MNDRLVKLSRHSFIRIYDGGKLGYILNQRTGLDRVYNDIGADFLSQIERTPRSITDIVANLLCIYKNVSNERILNDFLSFVEDLSKYKFVELSDNINSFNDEIANQDYSLSESIRNEISHTTDEKTSRYFWFKHDTTHPILRTLHVELTSKCNERCVHCFIPNSTKDAGVNMPFRMFKSIIDQFCEMGGLNVTLSGGEPLLNKDITKMIRYCRQKDLRISLFTNLLAMNESLIEVIQDVNISDVQVSLYSIEASSHDQVTQVKGSFEKTISAIERLKKKGIPVSISCPLMEANRNTIGELIKYAQSKGVPVKIDNIIMAQSNFEKSNLVNRLSLDDMEKALRDIIKNDVEHVQTQKQDTNHVYGEDYSELPLCSAATQTLCISSNGNVSPCVSLTGIVAGNVTKQSLNEIWTTSEQIKYIRSIRQKHFPKCLSCEAKKYCKMCMGQNFSESGGDIFKISQYFCDVAFLTKKITEENL